MGEVKDMKTWQIAKLIAESWGYTDPVIGGHARAALDVIRQSVPEEQWEEAIVLASRMQGQQ
jgi:hypothetical protein